MSELNYTDSFLFKSDKLYYVNNQPGVNWFEWEMPIVNSLHDHNIPLAHMELQPLQILAHKHVLPHHEVYKKFNECMHEYTHHILNESFNGPVVFMHREVISQEIVELMHNYFRNIACNITNIYFVTNTVGLKKWYDVYCRTNASPGLNIVELPGFSIIGLYDVCRTTITTGAPPVPKNITRGFVFYGGWANKKVQNSEYASGQTDRTFYYLFASQFGKDVHAEIMSTLDDRASVENRLEHMTWFSNQPWVQHYLEVYDRVVKDNGNKTNIKVDIEPTLDAPFNVAGLQQHLNAQCLFNITRETLDSGQFISVTEKTLRAFDDHQIIIPISGNGIIEELKEWGFWIADDLVDYSYLNAPTEYDKFVELEKEIKRLSALGVEYLNDYYRKNISNFEHNRYQLYKHPQGMVERMKKLIKQLSSQRVNWKQYTN